MTKKKYIRIVLFESETSMKDLLLMELAINAESGNIGYHALDESIAEIEEFDDDSETFAYPI